MEHTPRISEAEWQVMKVIWPRPPCTAQDIIAALSYSTDWSAATVKTLLNRLVKKQVLAFEKEGKSYRYRAAVSEEDCQQTETESFLQRVFDGALTPMIAHFANTRKLSPEEIGELKRLLKKRGDS